MDKIACSFGTYFLLRFQLVYSLGIAERNVVSSYRVTETRVFGSLHVFRVPKDNYNKCAKKNVQICTIVHFEVVFYDRLLAHWYPPLERPPKDTSD